MDTDIAPSRAAIDTFDDLLHAMFTLARRNVINDGGQTELLIGLNDVGAPACTFASAVGQDPSMVAAGCPAGTLVTMDWLVENTDNIAATFSRRGITASIYQAALTISGEPYLVTVGLWPHAMFVHGYAVPFSLVDVDQAVTSGIYRDSEVGTHLRAVAGWLASVTP